MNCSQCREQLVACVENLLDAQQQARVASHLQGCPRCRAEAEAHRQLRDRLARDAAALPSPALERVVMNRIVEQQAPNTRRITMSKRYGKAGLGLAAAAAITVLLVVPWGGGHRGEATAAEVFGQAAQAAASLQSVYIKLDVRTGPRENFASIDLDQPFAPHEMWKQSGNPPKYRVEKPGRVVVMDGQSSLLLIGGPDGRCFAAKGDPDAGFVVWLRQLLDVGRVLQSEWCSAEDNGWDWQLTKQTAPDGTLKLIVTIETKALGDYTNDWMKNKTLQDSDQRRVYRFDGATRRLEDLELWVHGDEDDVLVVDIEQIVYDPVLAPGLFTLDIPDDAVWSVGPEVLPDNDRYARMSPAEVARAFFQALSDEDWDEALKFRPHSEIDQDARDTYGGLKILKIGEPFRSGEYVGWFVPYKITCYKWGTLPWVKEWNLALRNDNEAGRYVVDGGF